MTTKLLAACAVLATGTLLVTHPSRACVNGVEHRINAPVHEIVVAERQVGQGQHELAARAVLKNYPNIKKRPLRGGLGDRAVKVMAQSVIRTRGELDGGPLFPGTTPEQKDANLAWSLHVLQTLSIREPNDMRAKTDLAEAFALFPERQADAWRMLTELESRDLMATAHGYAALAELRAHAGDGLPAFLAHPRASLERGRAIVARARCRVMAAQPDICAPHPSHAG